MPEVKIMYAATAKPNKYCFKKKIIRTGGGDAEGRHSQVVRKDLSKEVTFKLQLD